MRTYRHTDYRVRNNREVPTHGKAARCALHYQIARTHAANFEFVNARIIELTKSFGRFRQMSPRDRVSSVERFRAIALSP